MIELDEHLGAVDELPSLESGLAEQLAAAFSDFESIGAELAAGLGL